MPRGSNTLFADIFDLTPAVKQRKGRSVNFDSQRNQCLIDRYVFYGQMGFRYEILIKIITVQFFISERTVVWVLQENVNMLSEARKQKLAKKDLEKRWPHLNWDSPDLKTYI